MDDQKNDNVDPDVWYNGRVEDDEKRDIDDIVCRFAVVLFREGVIFARNNNISRTSVFKKRNSLVWLRERFLTVLDGEDYFRQELLKECPLPPKNVSRNTAWKTNCCIPLMSDFMTNRTQT